MTQDQIMKLVDAYASEACNHGLYGGIHWHKQQIAARAAVVAAIESLESEVEMWKATANAVVDFEKVELRRQVAALTKDAERLDHIQVTGSTVEIVNFGQKPVQHSFRVGGLYKAINFDLRLAIDAAIAAQKEQV